jgi:hypothetical protein
MIKRFIYFLVIAFIGAISYACKSTNNEGEGPKHVQLEQTNGNYSLSVDGEPFYVKGAGCEFGNIESLARHGANSFRTWRTENGQQSAQDILDEAKRHGLLVCMGLEIGRERHGFDYNDDEAVEKQFEYIKAEVLKYKDHPALLTWGIGNELNLNSSNSKVWKAVNDISKMIHKLDTNHPTTTMLAGFSKELGDELAEQAGDLDFLSFQFYADIINLPKYIKQAEYKGAYLVTEWGATGHWESPTTDWGRPLEQNSYDKANSYHFRYENVIAPDHAQCIGSYVFLWGQKQERTPTWYGMFLENGDETATVDVMHYIWNSEWPENRTPKMESLTMNDLFAGANIKLAPKASCWAEVKVSEPDGDDMTIHWEIIQEVPEDQQSDGGDFEARQETILSSFVNLTENKIEFTGPGNAGEYRLFVYVSDGKGHSATANIPFLVK